MSSGSQGGGRVDVSLNVKALRQADPALERLRDHAAHVVLYSFRSDSNEWEKLSVEGALFIYSRTQPPKYNMTVVNRLSTENLVQALDERINLQVQEPFLLYRNGDGRIFGLWFYDRRECARVSAALKDILREFDGMTQAGDPALPSPSSTTPNHPHHQHTSKRVLDFFAMAKNATPVRETRLEESASEPLLHRLLSCERAVHTLEQIEKRQQVEEHSSSPPSQPLFTPNMFVPASSSNLNNLNSTPVTPAAASSARREPDPDDPPVQPLTKAQLLQAVSYLLKNDADFVTKLHEAYVKSFSDRVL